MNSVAIKNDCLEILVSTNVMDSDEFIYKMFKNYSNFNNPVLVINQSKKKINFPKSNYTSIKTELIGLSNSRNLAIKNAKGKICLLADDDVIYTSDFIEIIINAFNENRNADVITFQAINDLGKSFKDYPKVKKHNNRSISTINSFLIAFRRKSIQMNNIKFDSRFGLGSTFETGDEYIFLRNALDKNLNVIHCPRFILSHKSLSSGQYVGNDKIIFARAAIFYKYYGFLSYIKLFHHLLLLLKINAIKFDELFLKYKVGLKGIYKFKSIS